MPLTIRITNTADHAQRPDYGNYVYVVTVNDDVLATGGIKDHRRGDGWEMLVFHLLEHVLEEKVRALQG